MIGVAIKYHGSNYSNVRLCIPRCKLGSLTFMFTMAANLLPSPSTMDNKELVSNIIDLIMISSLLSMWLIDQAKN